MQDIRAVSLRLQFRRPAIILAIYGLINLVLLVIVAPDAAYVHGGDAASWFGPAQALLQHGALVEIDDPATLQTFRPPLYPLFLAGFLWAGDGSFVPVLLAQIALLGITGWLARAIVEPRLPGYGDLALALVVFNPSALGTAHLIQSDTLYAFLVTATLWALFAFARSAEARYVIAAGLLFGLACLVRTTGQFLLYLWPLMFLLIGAAAGAGHMWKRTVAVSLLSLALAIAVLLPWMAHNHAADEGFSLSTAELKAAFLWDNVAYLEKYDRGISITEAEAAGRDKRAALAVEYGPGWDGLSKRQRFDQLVARGIEVFFAYPARTFAVAFSWAWAQFFGIPGVSNLTNILELTEESPFAMFVSMGAANYLEAGMETLRRAHPAAVLLTVVGFAYVFVLRGLGLLGLAMLIARRHWPELLIVIGAIAYFTLVHLFVANSRYRLPIEPLLILLTLYGLDRLRRRG